MSFYRVKQTDLLSMCFPKNYCGRKIAQSDQTGEPAAPQIDVHGSSPTLANEVLHSFEVGELVSDLHEDLWNNELSIS